MIGRFVYGLIIETKTFLYAKISKQNSRFQ